MRKSGFTIAPEAGTQRLRNVINKNLNEEQILNACRLAFEAGWESIKLYFMIGLPTETDADVDGLVDLAHEIHNVGRRVAKGRRPEVTLSASSFVPKPVTPFQWVGQERLESLYRKQGRIGSRVRRGVRFKHHECETTFLEGRSHAAIGVWRPSSSARSAWVLDSTGGRSTSSSTSGNGRSARRVWIPSGTPTATGPPTAASRGTSWIRSSTRSGSGSS